MKIKFMCIKIIRNITIDNILLIVFISMIFVHLIEPNYKSETVQSLSMSPPSILLYNKFPNIQVIDQTPSFSLFETSEFSNTYLREYKFNYCRVGKSMSTVMKAIICYLDNQTRHTDMWFDQQWQAGLVDSLCWYDDRHGSLKRQFLTAIRNKNFFNSESGIYHFSLIRDPLDRFISGYLDVCNEENKPISTKINYTTDQINAIRNNPNAFRSGNDEGARYNMQMCYGLSNNKIISEDIISTRCYGCKSNLTCFIIRLHEDFYRRSRHLTPTKWPRDNHFFPMFWLCDFDRYLHKYHLIRYNRTDAFRVELLKMFATIGVNNELLKEIDDKLQTKSTTHVTFNRKAEIETEIRQNPLLLEYIYKIYYLDYKWFEYSI